AVEGNEKIPPEGHPVTPKENSRWGRTEKSKSGAPAKNHWPPTKKTSLVDLNLVGKVGC
ncbi:unnamed protein product, partial [Staurois parvus]